MFLLIAQNQHLLIITEWAYSKRNMPFAIRYPRGSIIKTDINDIKIDFGAWNIEQISKNKS